MREERGLWGPHQARAGRAGDLDRRNGGNRVACVPGLLGHVSVENP